MSSKDKKKTVESPNKESKIAVRKGKETPLSRGFDTMFDDFRRSFDDLMAPFLPMRTWWPTITEEWPVRAPLVDLMDKGDKFVLKAELPGFKKEDVDIEINKDMLKLVAETKSEKEEKSDEYLHRERTYSTCQRVINFPEEVDPSKVEAKMVDGVLEVVAPKKEPSPEEKMRKVKLK